MFMKLLKDEEGATMTEYILLVILVAIALFAVIRTFGEDIAELFRRSSDRLDDAETIEY
jgi:Flp pilus assembly pilin Flp